MYLDNSDWLPSSSYDTLPKDEIKSLQMKLTQVEQTNLDNMTKLKEITNNIEPHSNFAKIEEGYYSYSSVSFICSAMIDGTIFLSSTLFIGIRLCMYLCDSVVLNT